MKVYIPSYKRANTIKTHLMLRDSEFDYKIIVHTTEELAAYKANSTIPADRIICSNAPLGVSHQRQWIKDNLCSKGEWYCMMDDNISHFTAVCPEEYFNEDQEKLYPAPFKKNDNEYRNRVYNQKIDNTRLMEVFKDTIEHAKGIGAKYCAFASQHNYFFGRSRKWSYWSYAISKAALYEKDDIPYDTNVVAMDDYYYTAENILRYGAVVVNKFVHAVGGHYEEGGIGRYEERQVKKIADCKYLMAKYPGLFRYKVKKNCHPEAELMIRFCYKKQIDAWRKEMLNEPDWAL